MSWDHPNMSCVTVNDGDLLIDNSYHNLEIVNMNKSKEGMSFTKWKMSSYINGLSKAGLHLEALIEDVPEAILNGEFEDYDRYYSKKKAQKYHYQ